MIILMKSSPIGTFCYSNKHNHLQKEPNREDTAESAHEDDKKAAVKVNPSRMTSIRGMLKKDRTLQMACKLP